MPAVPPAMAAAWRPVSMPSPGCLGHRQAGRRLADEPGQQPDGVGAAAHAGERHVRQSPFDVAAAGRRPRRRCAAAGRARWSGTDAVPSPSRARSAWSSTLVTQSRIASLTASLSVAVPDVTERTSAPSARIRSTFGAWRWMSSSPMNTTHGSSSRAHAVAVATPCCPAPVSAITRDLPRRRVSSAWPSALLILWAPVWARSSRLRYRRSELGTATARARLP